MPPDRRRLLIGIVIAVLGPLAATVPIRSGILETRPGLPFLLAIVAATVFARLLGAAVAIPWSLVLLDRYAEGGVVAAGQPEQDIWATAAFALVALVVALIVSRRDAAADVAGQERQRFRLLVSAGDSLSESLDIDETLRRLGDVLVPQLADWFSVDLLEDGTIVNAIVMHPDPAKVALAKDLQRRFPADPNAPSGTPNVVRTGVSELTETIPDGMLEALIEDPDLLETMRGLGLRCAMTVPLQARGKVIGAITLIGAETHTTYTRDDLQVAEEIADRAALAIDTARLFSAESAARQQALAEARRNEILKDVTAAFGRASSIDDVIVAMVDEGLPAAGARSNTVGLVEEGRRVVVRGVSGYEPGDAAYWHAFDLDASLPMSDAITQNRPIVLSTSEERDRRYPSIKGEGDPRDHVLVCVPLDLGGEVIGAFSASYPPGSEFDDSDLSLLRSIGEQCAQAIDRARALERADRAQERLVTLAAASQALARSLALDDTIATIVRLGADHLGRDVALVEIVDHGPRVLEQIGEPLPASANVEDLAVLDVDRLLSERFVLVPEPHGDGEPTLVLPLVIASSLSGALLVRRAHVDIEDPDDVVFAAEVARRMARALENARLYRDRDHVARVLQQGLLPPSLPDVPGLEIASFFRPAEQGQEIGGDFYDVFEISGGRWAAVVGDVCGKGAEAATLTGMVRHTLRSVADVPRPSDALGALNQALLREELDGRFCTVALLIVEPDARDGARVYVAVGGHPLPQRLTPDGNIARVGRHGTLLGVTAEPHLHDVELRLDPGSALVVFTDGLIDKHEVSGEEPTALLAALSGQCWGSATAICDRIGQHVADGGRRVHDDIAVLVLRAPDGASLS